MTPLGGRGPSEPTPTREATGCVNNISHRPEAGGFDGIGGSSSELCIAESSGSDGGICGFGEGGDDYDEEQPSRGVRRRTLNPDRPPW